MKVLILGGGDSPEREVSLRSAKAVANAAKKAGLDVMEKDPANGVGFLDSLERGTIIFPILHGKNGEDGVIQAEIEKRNLPFLGSGSQSSKDCFDKWLTRQKLEEANIVMPEGARVTRETYGSEPLSKKPHVLKVLNGGSSIGTLIVRDPLKIYPADIDKLFQLEDSAILEELIEGTEITVPVLDKGALPVIEIVPPENAEFDYENKYNGATQEIVPAENVLEDIQRQAQRITEQIHEVMECRHLSRTDFIIDKKGKLFALEINTIPGLTDQSLYPKSAKVAGYDMPALVAKFVELVNRDYNL